LKDLAELKKAMQTFQSGKDRGTHQLNKQVQSIQAQLAEYEKYRANLSPEDAQRQMLLDQLLAREFGGASDTEEPEKPGLAGQLPSAGGGAQIDPELLELLGLAPNDPELVQAMSQGSDPLTAAKTLAKARREKPTAPPSPAENIPAASGGQVNANQAALQTEYDQKMSKLPPGDWAASAALAAEYRKKGLNVW
jgi:hypothetical protein